MLLTRWRRGNWKVLACLAFVAPVAMASIVSFVPSKRYSATAYIIVDASRGNQAITSSEERRGNEVIQYDQVLKTQLSLAGSEDVIRNAIEALKPTRLYPDAFVTMSEQEQTNSDFLRARSDVSFAIEPNTFVLKFTYRNKDPVVAARFANQLANEYLTRRAALTANSGAVEFFKSQEVRYNEDLKQANDALTTFSMKKKVYSVAAQRDLLLKARAQAAKDLSDNAIHILRAESELNSLRTQISSLRAQTTLPSSIFGDYPKTAVARDTTLQNDPPLLNIRIYQESAAKLVTANAELAGLKATADRRAEDLRLLDRELDNLAQTEGVFNRLTQAVRQTQSVIENLYQKMGEARINTAWRSNEAFSSAQVFQNATTPLSPSFPLPMMFMGAGIFAGIFCSATVLYFAKVFNRTSVIPTEALSASSRASAIHANAIDRPGQPVSSATSSAKM